MSDKSKIEWTEATWNVVTGCSRVSEGCRHCYAERLAATRMAHVPAYEGLAEMTPAGPRWTGEVRFNADRLDLPLRWSRPRMVFVNSQSDLFHEGLTNEEIAAVFGVMAASPQHTFQVLTKRPERMREWFGWVESVFQTPYDAVWTCAQRLRVVNADPKLGAMRGTYREDGRWPLPNVWLGVSAEDQATADARIPSLLECPALRRWLSAEPLLGPIDLAGMRMTRAGEAASFDAFGNMFDGEECIGFSYTGLDWVVVGGESGPGARPMHPDWARQIRDVCVLNGEAFFFKQWGEWMPVPPSDGRGTHVVELAGGHAPRSGRSLAELADVGGQCVTKVGKRGAGRLLDGRTWDEMPVRMET